MSETLFGAPAGLFARLNRTEVRVPDVRAALARLTPADVDPELRFDVFEGTGAGPMVVLEEAGRRTRVLLAELATQMTRSRVAATPEGVTAAVVAWLARRPVPDEVAAAAGTALLDWSDPGETVLGWRVTVTRGALVVPWRPSRTASLPLVHQVRSAALGRAATVDATLRLQGPVGLCTATDAPGLDTAVLVRPESLLQEMADRGLRLRDGHVVVSPGRPVACAEGPVARRLAAEATEPCATLPWQTVADLGWA
ncbi:hypothetical protein O2W14_15810 [Modestobacter sp. VKM Ac-2986]|uniref:hypothetical protein n=1 Tax=Modestobacter sp. VKM Ac-2986 TaxID=3004140 RepID=UPI0022ABB739|nr:hypothetical protein [Modestobacter sp. VKM Ac-2986]MCZ2830302.1 hypothetical protein [Modestobacter sp. VKM Ac-2986]